MRTMGVCLLAFLSVFLTVVVANAGDLTTDNLTVQQNLTIYRGGDAWNVSNSIVYQWHLNDNTTNTTVTDSAGTGDGTLAGGETTAGVHTNGHVGTGAFEFDGNDHVDTGYDPTYATTNDFSYSMWFKSSTASKSLFSTVGDGNNDIRIVLDSTDCYQVFVRDNSGNTDGWWESTTEVQDDEWHHLVVVRNTTADKYYIYVDGVLDMTGDDVATTDIDLSTEPLWIGGQQGSSIDLVGCMDEVLVFNKALSSTEVLGLYNQGSGTEALSGETSAAQATVGKLGDIEMGIYTNSP